MQKTALLLSTKEEIPGHPCPENAYYDHPVVVPEGVSQLRVTLSYYRDAPEWDLIILAFDPEKYRGDASLNAANDGPTGNVELTITIGDDIVLGDISGPVTPGRWLIQVWAAHVNQPLSYHLLVEAIRNGDTASPTCYPCLNIPDLDRSLPGGSGWYKGELHTHTIASDGYITPQDLLEQARGARLDFLAITDHNTIGAWHHLANTDDVCVIPSMEVTLPDGHCNVWGLQRWLDWRERYEGREITDILFNARAQGAMMSVNHPFAPGYSWKFDCDVALTECIEVLNYPCWWPAATEYNLMALGLWTSMLNAGHNIVAVGGSDVFHYAPGVKYQSSPYEERIGWPATYVYADRLSARSILEGLRRSRAYISMGPRLQFEAQVNSERCGIGEWVQANEGAIRFFVDILDAPEGGILRLVKNGQVLSQIAVELSEVHCSYVDTPDWSSRNWYRVDLFNPDGEIWLVSNPIYVGHTSVPPKETWQRAIERARSEGLIIEQTIFE